MPKITNFKETPTLDLAQRMNEISWFVQELQIEYNAIIKELQTRHPNLENDPNMELMGKKAKTH